jgi:hypothetical protein
MSPFIPVATPQFLLVLLASVGMHGLLTGATKKYSRWSWAFGIFSIIGVSLFIFLFIPPSLLNPDTRWEIEHVKLAAAVTITGTLAILIPLGVFVPGKREKWIKPVLMPLAIILAGFCAHYYQYPIWSETPVMPETSSTAALPRTPLYRVIRHSSGQAIHAASIRTPLTFGGNLPMWAGCYDSQGADSFTLVRTAEILKALDSKSFAWNGLALPLTDPEALSSPLLDAMAVGTVISDDPGLLSGPHMVLDPDEYELVHTGALNIYQRQNCLPRWYLASRILTAEDHSSAFSLLKETTILDDNPGVVLELVDGAPIPNPVDYKGGGQLTIVSEDPQYIEFNVNPDQSTYLVLADSYHPQWHAFVDGEETTVYPANGAYRAVYVPAGMHTVDFRYIPRDFQIGAIISGSTLLLLLAGCGLEFILRRKTVPIVSQSDLNEVPD